MITFYKFGIAPKKSDNEPQDFFVAMLVLPCVLEKAVSYKEVEKEVITWCVQGIVWSIRVIGGKSADFTPINTLIFNKLTV